MVKMPGCDECKHAVYCSQFEIGPSCQFNPLITEIMKAVYGFMVNNEPIDMQEICSDHIRELVK